MKRIVAAAVAVMVGAGAAGAVVAPGRQAVLAHYAALARREDPPFRGFSASAGRAFFLAHPGTGRPGTPSCATCHRSNPRVAGRTPAGKTLRPMAVSRSPGRFTRLSYADRWFRRMCHQVYGRDCTAVEKGDFITYMETQ